MQLGTRWPVGGEIPRALPESVSAAIRSVEEEIAQLDTTSWRWTLTYLEGRPVVDLDDGTQITHNPYDDSAVTRGAVEEHD